MADVTIPTVKFYLRQGLLPAGTAMSMTQADYEQSHVERLRLIRALVDVGGLSLGAVRTLLAALDSEGEAAEPKPASAATSTSKPKATSKSASTVAAAAVRALNAAHEALPPQVPDRGLPPNRALAAVSALGWQVDPGSFALRQLDAALIALDTVGVPPSVSTLLTYGEAADRVARADVDSIPAGTPDDVIRHLVLGTVMYEPVLIALRRLAEQNALLGRR